MRSMVVRLSAALRAFVHELRYAPIVPTVRTPAYLEERSLSALSVREFAELLGLPKLAQMREHADVQERFAKGAVEEAKAIFAQLRGLRTIQGPVRLRTPSEVIQWAKSVGDAMRPDTDVVVALGWIDAEGNVRAPVAPKGAN